MAPVICDVGKISDTKHFRWYVRKNTASGDINVRMGWYINYYKRFLYYRPNWRDLWTCYGHAHAAATQQKYGIWWGDKWHAPMKAISYHNTSHARIELQAAAVWGLGC